MPQVYGPMTDAESEPSSDGDGRADADHDSRFGRTKRENMSSGEAWLCIAAGAGLLLGAVRTWSAASLPLAAAGASLLYRGSTRHCPVYSAMGIDHGPKTGPDAVGVITIDKPAQELYRFWRDLRNAPRFMSFVEGVDILNDKRSRWRGREIGKYAFDYEAEILEDIPDRGFRWRSVEGAPIEMRGSVRFTPAPADRGTIVVASVIFGRSGGGMRGWLAGPFAHYTIHGDLQRLKQLMETGEIATADGPSGRRGTAEVKRSARTRRPESRERNPETWAGEFGASWS